MWEELINAISINDTARAAELIGAIDPKELSEKRDQNGQTALIWAAFNGRKEVWLLIPKMTSEAINAVPTSSFYGGQTALHFTAEKGTKEVCELLIPQMTPAAASSKT
jgi:hypothetical protein